MTSRLRAEDSFGPFKIIRLIDEGGNAVVYEVRLPPDGRRMRAGERHTVPDERAALKILLGDPGLASKNTARLAQEGVVLAGLSHPHVVQFYDAGITDNQFWLLLEL